MKKINILTSILVATALLTACEDDRDSNPTIQEPTTFVLNTPANATYNVYDLNQSKNIELTCTQPDYGYLNASFVPLTPPILCSELLKSILSSSL